MILFVDDCPRRREWAKQNLRAVCLEDAETAIEFFRIGGPPKGLAALYLDHDLGDETFADSSRPDTGMEVVRWIVEHKPVIGRVVVHSLNAPAANVMVGKLLAAGYAAEYVPFLRLVEGWRSNGPITTP